MAGQLPCLWQAFSTSFTLGTPGLWSRPRNGELERWKGGLRSWTVIAGSDSWLEGVASGIVKGKRDRVVVARPCLGTNDGVGVTCHH